MNKSALPQARRSKALLTLMLALAGSSVLAATQVKTASFAQKATESAAQVLELGLFDPTLGDLTGVSLSFGGTLSVSADVVNNSAALNLSLVNVTVFGSFSAGLTAGPAALPASVNLLPPNSSLGSFQFTILGPGAHTSVGPFTISVASGPNFQFSAPADLLAFQGPGVLGYQFSTASQASVPARFTTVSLSPTSLSDATLSVTYTYTPAAVPPLSPVPEPGAWAMLLAGLGLGFKRLRRSGAGGSSALRGA